MITIILAVHITIAILSLALSLGVVVKAKQPAADLLVQKMWLSTAFAVISGFLLSFAAHAPITQACASSLMLVAVISAAHVYKKLAAPKISSLS